MSWSPGPDIHVRIVTEDGSEHAHDTVTHLLKRMFQIIEPGFATNRLQDHELRDRDARHAARATCWGARTPNDRRIVTALVRTIASDLLAGRFVAVHVDADAPWSKAPSRNKMAFEEALQPLVRAALSPEATEPRTPRRTGPTAERARAPDEIDRLLQRMLLLVPYFKIESWLYQNTEVAVRICHEKYQGKHVEILRGWQSRRASLDEEGKADLEAICLKKAHNSTLASEQYPAHEVHAAGASFHAAVEGLRESRELCAALVFSPA